MKEASFVFLFDKFKTSYLNWILPDFKIRDIYEPVLGKYLWVFGCFVFVYKYQLAKKKDLKCLYVLNASFFKTIITNLSGGFSLSFSDVKVISPPNFVH